MRVAKSSAWKKCLRRLCEVSAGGVSGVPCGLGRCDGPASLADGGLRGLNAVVWWRGRMREGLGEFTGVGGAGQDSFLPVTTVGKIA